MSSLMDGNREFRKQIGCMNGISQLFDRHHYLTSWRISSHSNKKLLKGTQCQLNSQHATRAAAEKVENVQKLKLKQRVSMDSSRASCLSSSSSSTLSSIDSHGTAGPTSLPQRQISVQGDTLDLRDVVKESMYSEARCLHVKIQTKDKSRDHVKKHIDSPRPMQQHKSGKPETTGSEGSKMFLAKFQESTKNSKDARLTLARFSYDGRESRETFQSSMKNSVLPRLSLDSKVSSMKCSFLDSKSNLPRRDDLQIESESYSQVLPLKQEPEGQNRSSSVVAKLMGLNDFPDTISAERSRIPKVELSPKKTLLSKSSTTTEKSKQNQVSYSPRASQNNPTSQSQRLHSASSTMKPTEISRFPVESAPWRQQNPTQGSQKKIQQSRKAATIITQHPSSSVYGEVEKMVADLEFKKSGKDLRALKQILEAMQKTKERLENQIGESNEVTSQRSSILEDSLSDQNSSLSMFQSSNNYHKVPPSTRASKHSVSYIVIEKPAKVIDEKKLSSSNQLTEMGIHRQRIRTLDLKHEKENSTHRQRAKYLTPRNNNLKYSSKHLPSIDNRTSFELAGTSKSPQVMKAENCSGRSLVALSPRLRQNLPKTEGKSIVTVATSSDTSRIKIHSKENITEKVSPNKNGSTKSKYSELSDDQLSDFSADTRFSSYQRDSASVKSETNNILASHKVTKVISLSHSIHPSASQHQEQPSPVSVLDATFYGEDSPSPMKRISTTFRDQSPSPDEANWHLENLNHFIDCPISDQSHVVHEARLSKAESKECEIRHGSLNPNQRYINKIVYTSGLLKGTSFIPMGSQFLSSDHVINPDMFNVLEQIEGTMPGANREFFAEKNYQKLLDQKTERKIVFDMVNEILIQKVTSGKRSISPPELAKEICQEMERLSRMPDDNFDQEEDRLKGILTRDMMHQSEDWSEYSGEIPALVLDIERQIFKDLVNEVVSVDHAIVHLRKNNRKQLFTM